MLIAITGGSGFVGRRVVERHLNRGDRVRVLSRKDAGGLAFSREVEIHRGDLSDGPEALRRFVDGAEILYHCAGEIRDVSRMRATHVEGARGLLAAASGRIGHWVQLSSVEAYGPPWSLPPGLADESLPLNPRGEYEVTKTEADRLVEEASRQGAFTYSILRPSKIMGEGMRDRSIFQMLALIKRGLFFFIGRPGAIQNYIPVDDVVDALYLCGTKPAAKGRVYIVSDHMTIEDFVATAAGALGRPVPTLRIPEKAALWPAAVAQAAGLKIPLTPARVRGLMNRAVFSTARIERELSYAHGVWMEDELRRLASARPL